MAPAERAERFLKLLQPCLAQLCGARFRLGDHYHFYKTTWLIDSLSSEFGNVVGIVKYFTQRRPHRIRRLPSGLQHKPPVHACRGEL
jgi:hypothetical protein